MKTLKKKTETMAVLSLLLISMVLVSNVPTIKASGTIYIRTDGSVYPPTAPIHRDGDTYTFTDNINDSIVVERDNILVDGAGHTVQGTGASLSLGIHLYGTKNVTVKNTQIKNFYGGIYLDSSSSNSVIGNNMTDNYYGVWLDYSSYSNIISGNNMTANIQFGIELDSFSSDNSVSGNNMTDNGAGIGLYYSSDNSVIGNNMTDNGYGVWLDYSSGNIISGNTFTNDGLAVYYSYQNSVEDNTVNGKPLVYLEGVTNYSVGDAGQVVLVRCDSIRVENLNLSRASVGVQLWETNSSTISWNNMTANSYYGVWLDYSSSNIISGNSIAANSYYGVWLDYSSGNIISGNSIAANSYYGVWLDYSSGNIISGNTFTDDGLFVGGSYQNSVEDNTVNGKPLVYLEGVTNYSVGDAGQVVLVRCDSIRVENLNLSRASVGVQLWETNSSTISWNNITNNDDGVWLDYSFNNEIYHNSFINNTSQVSSDRSVNVWDDGYPSGGNYWSDYTCLDLYKGPYQNETSSDGIGDASYVIDANNTDRYPLMKPYPWGPHDVGVTYIGRCYEIGVSILIYPLRTVAGLNILLHLDVFVMNYGDYTEVLDLTMYANSTIISQVSNVTLAAKNSTILDVLWDTSGFEMGNYTLSAYLKSVPGDSDVKDNNYTDGHIIITIPGDLNGDFKVSLVDLVILAQAYGSKPGDSNWNPNADIDDNGIVRLSDLVTLAQDYGRTS